MPNWKDKLAELPEGLRKNFHQTFSWQYMEYLDKGLGACVLKQPRLAKIVADSLLHFNGNRYHIGDFVIMPNQSCSPAGLFVRRHRSFEAMLLVEKVQCS